MYPLFNKDIIYKERFNCVNVKIIFQPIVHETEQDSSIPCHDF